MYLHACSVWSSVEALNAQKEVNRKKLKHVYAFLSLVFWDRRLCLLIAL